MLNNTNYTIERRYKLYASIPLGQRSKGGVAIAIKKEISHKRLNIRTTLQAIALEIQSMGKGKRIICSIYLPPRHNKRGGHTGAHEPAANTDNNDGRF